jgi:hypothetical protein
VGLHQDVQLTDGLAFTNRTGPYEYLSYDFNNRSRDIVELFAGACERVGVRYRLTGTPKRWSARINRRASVVLMEEHVGRKA